MHICISSDEYDELPFLIFQTSWHATSLKIMWLLVFLISSWNFSIEVSLNFTFYCDTA